METNKNSLHKKPEHGLYPLRRVAVTQQNLQVGST